MILLTWNRDQPETWYAEDYEKDRRKCMNGKTVNAGWSVGRRKNIPIGTTVFMLVQGNKNPRGLIAKGITTSLPKTGKHYAIRGKTTNYVGVCFTEMLPLNDPIPSSALANAIPEIPWIRQKAGWIQSSGYQIPEKFQNKLDKIWREFSEVGEIPEPGEVSPEKFPEGGTRTITVNRYERNPQARKACLDHFGAFCQVCDIDLIQIYGQELAEKMMHVHHIQPMATKPSKAYTVDPRKDLVPLCPNCHNVIHKFNPVLTPKQLKLKLS
jgi:5-methylcytosine-specific restriction protein A